MKRALLGKQQKAISYKEFLHSWFSLPAFIQPSCPGENWIFQAPFLLVFHSCNDFLAWTVFLKLKKMYTWNSNIELLFWDIKKYVPIFDKILQCEKVRISSLIFW